MNKLLSVLTVSALCAACGGQDTPPHEQEFHEAVIVGSGYGGSVAALRLGLANVETVVYEKGRRWDITDTSGNNNTFATYDSIVSVFGDSRSSWLRKNCFFTWLQFKSCDRIDTGIIEIMGATPNKNDLSPAFSAHNTSIMAGVGVGGGSLVNNAETFPPTRAMWNMSYDIEAMPYLDNVWNDLSTVYFNRANDVLQPEYIPEDILQSEHYANSREHTQVMIDAGYPMIDPTDETVIKGSSHTPMIIDWDAVREEIDGQRTPSTINGDVWFGINSGAKNSLDKEQNYLGLAEATGSVQVHALHTVTDITYDAAKALYVVNITKTDQDYNVISTLEVTTPKLIMAAGSIGTTKLLIAAKNQGGLPLLNEHLGTKWVNNGNGGTMRESQNDADTDIFGGGGPASIKTYDFEDPNAPINIQLLPLKTGDSTSLFTIVLGIPTGEGYFDYDEDGVINLHWPEDASKNVYDRFEQVLTHIEELGLGSFSDTTHAIGQAITLHPLGGVPLGLATDEHCRLKGYDGLYAVDGSIIPGPSLANPSLLIAAMAERCMDTVLADMSQ